MKRDVEELMDTLDTQWEDVRGLITQPVRVKEKEREREGREREGSCSYLLFSYREHHLKMCLLLNQLLLQ